MGRTQNTPSMKAVSWGWVRWVEGGLGELEVGCVGWVGGLRVGWVSWEWVAWVGWMGKLGG